MNFTNEDVRQIREKTGAGIMECKRALEETSGNIENALTILRKKGIAVAAKKSSRTAKEGRIESYIHLNNKIGVLVEVNCETDFVARTDDFNELAKNLAMHIAASAPVYIDKNQVPASVIEKEKEVFRSQVEGKPANVTEKIIEGKLEKFFQGVCLLNQPFVREPEITVADYVTSKISKIGENIIIRRFIRYQLGEEL